MLSILLLLAAAPQAAEPAVQTLRPASVQELIDAGAIPQPLAPTRNAGDIPVLGRPFPGCRSEATPAADLTVGNTLLWREGQDSVGHYLLLERRVGGCPDPLVVNYRVPGSNAVGREIGRTPAPLPQPRR